MLTKDKINNRTPEYPIDDLFLKRWSARAMSGEEISDDELMSLFEAAKWAPSSVNEQPWRFIYAKRNTEHWDAFFNLASEGNRLWIKNAAVLVIIASKKKLTKYDSENRTHSFSAGSAFENLALQGTMLGLIIHPFGGFEEDEAAIVAEIPDSYFVNAMIAIGKPGSLDMLNEKDKAREIPSQRKPLKETVMEGKFKE